jgi:hypothetical protein
MKNRLRLIAVVAPGLGCGISRLPLRGLLVAANLRQTGKKSHDMERREHLVNSKYQQQTRMPRPSDSPSKTHFERTFHGRNPMLTSANSSGNIGDPDERFRSQAVSRLYRAIVNRAVLDLLENGKNSPAAKRWLLSRDFDRLQELFLRKIPNTLEVTEERLQTPKFNSEGVSKRGVGHNKTFTTVCASKCG